MIILQTKLTKLQKSILYIYTINPYRHPIKSIDTKFFIQIFSFILFEIKFKKKINK